MIPLGIELYRFYATSTALGSNARMRIGSRCLFRSGKFQV
jgi:hypothetical protein